MKRIKAIYFLEITSRMDNSLISVIIPVYNVERFLQPCIESVCNQSYKNLQIILIDDGSLDKCGEICDEYAKKDSRIEVIHQKNYGVSVARNEGLKCAKGEWIAFCDSDDVLPWNAYENLVNSLRNSQLIMGRMQLMTEVGELQLKVKELEKESINSKEFLFDLFLENKYPYLGYPWDKLFQRSIIELNQIKFDPEVKLNEDRLFILQYMIHCQTVDFCNEIVYYYRQRSNGVITSAQRNEIVTDSEMTVIKAFEKMQYYAKGYSEELYYLICRKSFESALDLLNRVQDRDKEKKRLLMRFLWENSIICLKNPNYGISEKVKIIGHTFLKR